MVRKHSRDIKCKVKRTEVYKKEKRDKAKEKKEIREKRKKETEALGDDVSSTSLMWWM